MTHHPRTELHTTHMRDALLLAYARCMARYRGRQRLSQAVLDFGPPPTQPENGVLFGEE